MADDPDYLNGKRETLRARMGHWTAEVVLVFLGVSAAFWLNNYQQHEQDAKIATGFWPRSSGLCRKGSQAEESMPRERNESWLSFSVRSTPGICRGCARMFSQRITVRAISRRSCNPAVLNCSTWKLLQPCGTTNRSSAGA
jgi:hypothetical protein